MKNSLFDLRKLSEIRLNGTSSTEENGPHPPAPSPNNRRGGVNKTGKLVECERTAFFSPSPIIGRGGWGVRAVFALLLLPFSD